ncbi:MAG: tRNA pseudouridine(38-40) synthase TruA [Sulfuricurvum sp.]|nr:tRNA pseudouridine(38-40) synthase TruA [Sulfuricurvum sp.]MDD3769703.1 tRNA pseudouridine(38-40) synthase TruA [Sulfuricurvum sp.]
MNRVKLTLSYNGAAFMGFQSQTTTDNTVVGTLHAAFKRLGIDSLPVGSGRTDRGVHATRQVIHLDLPPYWQDLRKLREMLALQLPYSIRIRRIEPVADDFHARYGARVRSYRYVLKAGESNPFEADFVTFVPRLDEKAIIDAIRLFEGEHDFELFKKSGSDTTHYVRTIFRAYAYSHRGYLILRFDANGFLRSQIRLMVGFLLRISEGKATKEQLQDQLSCRYRHCSDLAPHNGLYLSRVNY